MRRTLLLGLGLTFALLIGFVVILSSFGGDERVDCRTLRDPAPGAWQAADFAGRDRIVSDFTLCERLVGRSQADVEALLGSPTEVGAGVLTYRLAEPEDGRITRRDSWTIRFDADGRVERTETFLDRP